MKIFSQHPKTLHPLNIFIIYFHINAVKVFYLKVSYIFIMLKIKNIYLTINQTLFDISP